MSSARIVIDPGHCNTDPGALGFREDYNEYEVNLAISKYLKAELESMGAYVYMNDTTNGRVELLTRLNNGKSADPHPFGQRTRKFGNQLFGQRFRSLLF